jgi:hypothetical protein
MPEKETKDSAKTRDIFLTETILSIHNDVQSAIDYISEVASRESTELGMSSAIMGIEKLRIKLPFIFEMEQKDQKVEEKPPTLDVNTVRRNLAYRKGFLIDKGAPGKLGLYSKIKVLHTKVTEAPDKKGEAEDIAKQQMVGEIEIVFAPLGREQPK